MLILFIYYSYCVAIFNFSILGLIFIDEFLAVVFGTKPSFVSIIVSSLYLDYPLLDYFRTHTHTYIYARAHTHTHTFINIYKYIYIHNFIHM